MAIGQLRARTVAKRLHIEVQGAVQGVGFRPFVHRLAGELSLAGFVENTPRGVTIEVEGAADALDGFQERLQADKPALAFITNCHASTCDSIGSACFEIRKSNGHGAASAIVLPDIATCDDCLRECLDPRDRRYRYPFINCTHCGPRFSIIRTLPYDRPNTSMRRFAMCDACRREYEDPTDRRFHAQPIACDTCGPRLALWDRGGRVQGEGDDALWMAATALREGRIVALKGIGGFQLLVDARNDEAVASLRGRKHREEKPFAVMMPSLDAAKAACEVSASEAALLRSIHAPIVLLRAQRCASDMLAAGVAPSNPFLGVMLPYSPLHHLLMRELAFAVVATSGNRSDEPICTDEREALRRLEGIADVFLVHDRPIVRHVDDSVVRVISGRPMMLRRARGYAPLPIQVNADGPPILAVGAQQKSAVAMAHGRHVFVSQHIGDLVTHEACAAFERAATDLPQLYGATPTAVACDLHPDYVSTNHATAHASSTVCDVVAVQHHHAHIVACMAENDLAGTVLGVSWDGTGYGPDGTIWGGEFLRCTPADFERVARLRTFALPGGDAVARQPRRSALGLLYELYGEALFDRNDINTVAAFDLRTLGVIRGMLARDINCPRTSSMGRLFDAVASLLGIRQLVRHEGQAAMELEFIAEQGIAGDAYAFDVVESAGAIDWSPMVTAMLDDLRDQMPICDIARRFQITLVEMIVAVARRSNEDRIVLSGGCFQNRLLSEMAITRLQDAGFKPYWHQHVPPNDGGIALGQAVVARERIKERCSCV